MERKWNDRRFIRSALYRWGRVNETVERLQRDVLEWQTEIESCYTIRAQALTGMPGGGGPGDPTLRNADRAMEIRARLSERIREAMDEIEGEILFGAEAERFIRTLPRREADIIDRRYRKRKSWEEISAETHYGIDRLKQIEAAAVDRLGREGMGKKKREA